MHAVFNPGLFLNERTDGQTTRNQYVPHFSEVGNITFLFLTTLTEVSACVLVSIYYDYN